MSDTFAIQNTTKSKPPRLPFFRMKNEILGANYELSLVFIGDQRSRTLNLKYRKKDKPTNVLSFPLSDTEGEVCINIHQAKKDAPSFKKRYNAFIALLFIHGCLHLKGMEHSKEMEKEEFKLLQKFGN